MGLILVLTMGYTSHAHSLHLPPLRHTSHHPNDVAHQYCGHCHLFCRDLADLQRTVPRWQALRQAADDGAPPALLAWAFAQGYAYVRTLPDGRVLCVSGLTYGRARLHVGTHDDIVDAR